MTIQPAQLCPSWVYTQGTPAKSRDTGPSVLTASAFTIAVIRKQPTCLSINERISIIYYTHKVKFDIIVRINEITAFVEKWVGLDISVFIEIRISQTQTNGTYFKFFI